MNQPLVSIIVPAKNSEVNLEELLSSLTLSTYVNIEIIINDDVNSSDGTADLVKLFADRGMNIHYYRQNKSMAQGRKQGAMYAKGEILLHLDSDMKIMPQLVEECVQKIASGADALVVPEESFGSTFWAKCKWLEKKCYEGIKEIESLRCITMKAYMHVGGHDEAMVFSEDKDLDIRVHASGFVVGRTENRILHNEGELTIRKSVSKKIAYASTADKFAATHPSQFAWQRNILHRYFIFALNYRYLFSHPVLYIGLIVLKTTEYGASAIGLYRYRSAGRAG